MSNAITACVAGTYNTQLAQTACISCDYGTYQPSISASTCLTCPAGLTVSQLTTTTEFPQPFYRHKTSSSHGKVYIMRNYLIASQGHNLTKWSFFAVKSGCMVTPAIFRADVSASNLYTNAWFTVWERGTPRVSTAQGVHTFDFIEGGKYFVRAAVNTGVPYVNSYEFLGWIFDDNACIPYDSTSFWDGYFVMSFTYDPVVSAYYKNGNSYPPSQTWAVQITYEFETDVPSTATTGTANVLQCKCPANTRQLQLDGSCLPLCDPGYYTLADGSCGLCVKGSYCLWSTAIPCPSGQSSAPGASSCVLCGGTSDIQLNLCGLLNTCVLDTPLQLPGTMWFGLGNIVISVGGQGIAPITPWFSGDTIAGMVLNVASDRPYALLQQLYYLPTPGNLGGNSPVAFQFSVMCTGTACSQVQFRVQWSDDGVVFSNFTNATTVTSQWTTVTMPYILSPTPQIGIRIIAHIESLSAVVWLSSVKLVTPGQWTFSNVSSVQLANTAAALPVPVSATQYVTQNFPALTITSSSVHWLPSAQQQIFDGYVHYATVYAKGPGNVTVRTSAQDYATWAVPVVANMSFFLFTFTPAYTPTMFSIETVGSVVVAAPRLTLRTPYVECQTCLMDHWCANQLIYECPMHSVSAAMSTAQTDCYCIPGFYGRNGSVLGYTPCSLCPVNYYCTGGNSILICAPGFKSEAGSSVCAPCDVNEYCANGQVGACPLHSHSPSGSDELLDCICDDGYYGFATSCTICEVGYYCQSGIRTACAANALTSIGAPNPSSCYCDRGYYGVGSVSCTACEEGTWCWTGIRNLCPSNMWSPAMSNFASNCSCTYGYHRSPTQACVPCDTGTYKTARIDGVCTSCDPGTYSTAVAATAISTCAHCPIGTFSSDPAQYQCQSCAAGYYASGLGNTWCSTCWPGSYSGATAGVCTTCAAGTMSIAVAATSISVCQACVPGSWSSGNTSSCNICGVCPFWSYPPVIFFNVLSLQPAAANLNNNVNFAALLDGRVLMSFGTSLFYADLAMGVTTYQAITVPGVGGPFASLSSSGQDGFVYAVQGVYVFRIDMNLYQWDIVYPSSLATCVVEDKATGLVWIAQTDGVRALDAVSTAVISSFSLVGSHHVCIHAAHQSDVFVTGSFGLKRVNKTSGADTNLLLGSAYTVCAFTPDGNFIVLSQPDTQTAWAYSLFDAKLTKILNNAVLTDIMTDNATIVFASQNSGIQNVSYSFNDSRSCGPGKYSLYSGLQLESQCQECPAGGLCPGGANITQCSPGTYSLALGNREQAQCSVCPAGFACTGGDALIMCGIGSYSTAQGLDQPYNCPVCDAGYFCPNATTQLACPPNTMSDAGSSDLGQCVCAAGYRCIYTRVVHVEITLPMSLSEFTADMQSRYVLAIALATGVDVSQVRIVSVHQVSLTGRRRLLQQSANGLEIHVSVYDAPQNVHVTDLDRNLNGLGLPAHHAYHMSVHMEVVDSIKL